MYDGKFAVDVHTHVWPEDVAPKAGEFLANYYGLTMSTLGLREELQATMKESGVDISVVFSVATAVKQVEKINDFLSGITDDNIVVFGAIHPDYPDYKKELKRIKKMGFRGIKLHSDFQEFNIDDIRAMRIYEEIGDTMPILMHLGDETKDYSAPRRLAKVLDEMPYLKVIGAHLGGYKSWEEASDYLLGRDLYIDTCSALHYMPLEQAEEIIHKHGADKVLFGTDFPTISQLAELKKFDELDLTENERTLILGENAKKLLNL